MAESWADLPPELLELCSRQLLLEDWFAFRSVCSTWRVNAFRERFDFPWLMLADEDKSAESMWAEFRCLFTSRIHRVLLPEAKSCLSSRGWILTIGKDSEIRMLNPLSRAATRYRDDIIVLPSKNKISGLDYDEGSDYDEDSDYEERVVKFILSASPASSPNYTVMVIYWPSGPLGFWKPGNEEWKLLTLPDPHDPVLDHVFDVIHYQGQFIAVNSFGSILRLDPDGPDPIEVLLETPQEFEDLIKFCANLYLVESAGRLLLVWHFREDSEDYTTGFKVFAVDLDARKWTKLESMGNACLFVGFNSSFSVHVDENQHGIKPNCIYFTRFRDMGTYYMEDGRIEFDKKADRNRDPPLWIDSPPLWIEPSF